MRSPLANPNNHHHHHLHQLCLSKPTLTATTTTTTATDNSSSLSNNSGIQFCYEPTSVLDLRRSPSPVLGGADSATVFPAVSDEQSALHCWDIDHPHLMMFPSEDWDPSYSMMLGFGDKDNRLDDVDDSVKTLPQFLESPNPILPNPSPTFVVPSHSQPQPPPPTPFLLNHDDFIITNASSNSQFMNFSQPHTNFDFDSNSATSTMLDRLIRAAEAVESNDLQLAQVILARLNQQQQQQQQTQLEKPLLRSALHFKEALQSILSGASPNHHLYSSSDTIQKIRAYKSFSEVSPITMFANFTANQALLETLDGAMFLHIIDFDIGFGGQWASFMQEIATKANSRGVHPSNLRITAIVSEDSSIEAKLVKDNLQQFAHELGIQFQIEFVFFRSFEVLHFNSVRILNSELLAVNLSPAIFRHLGGSSPVADFLRFLRRISPRITVFVDSDGWRDAAGGSSFRRNFVNGVQFYSVLLESLDAVNNGNLDLVRRIERFLIQPRIFAAVSAAAGSCVVPWRELLSGAGMSPVAFSQFTDTQAEWLVRRTQVRNFHVAKRQGEMLLCWHGRVLVSTSAWRC